MFLDLVGHYDVTNQEKARDVNSRVTVFMQLYIVSRTLGISMHYLPHR